MLPKDFGIPWFVVYDRYRRWNEQGVWERILCTLMMASRLQDGRAASPTCAIIDGQSVKTVYGGKQRSTLFGGIDGGRKRSKEANGTLSLIRGGHVLAVHVHAAHRHDSVAAPVVMARALIKYPTITTVCGDAGYRGTAVRVIETLTKKRMQSVEKLP
jgi:hypothetical protein